MDDRKGIKFKFLHRMTMALAVMAALVWLQAMPVQAEPRVLGSQPSGTSGQQDTSGGDDSQDAEQEEETPDAVDDSQQEDTSAAATAVTSATVTADSVNVRSEASTSSSVAGKVSNGTEVTVTEETTGSDGRIWYGVTYEDNGTTVTGYIRSDLVEAHETAVEPEQPEPEEPQPEEPVEPAPSDDYYVQYTDDGTGTGTNDWFLVDSVMAKSYKVSELLGAQDSYQNNLTEMEKQAGRLRAVIFVLAAVVLILIVVVTVFIIKLKNASEGYEDDDDDEDEEDDEEEDEEDEEEVRRRPRRTGRRFSRRRERYRDEDDDEDEDDEEEEEDEEPPRRTSRSQKDKNWQSKNFLDDDDLEFEFLDLK